MTEEQIRFTDGAAYERYMGRWSRLVAADFLDWLAPDKGLRWLDIGCGNGAFTEVVAERCAPKELHGIDPAEAQLAYAKTRPVSKLAQFQQADAMALPFAEGNFDAAVMPLVLFFVPDPMKGLAEMRRVLAPGGHAAAYTWDMHGGGFPYTTLREELEAAGVPVPRPPSVDATEPERMRELWKDAGFKEVDMTVIEVRRTFANLDDYWTTVSGGPSVGPKIAALGDDDKRRLKQRLGRRLGADEKGRIAYAARANAVKGRA